MSQTRPKLHAQIVTGILVAMLLWLPFAETTTVHAQFGGPVTVIADTSPTGIANSANIVKSLAEDIKRNVEEAARWLETKEHYIRDIEEQVKRFTKLKEILDTAQEMIAHKDAILSSMTDIAATIRSIIQLKNQIEWMVVRQVASIRNIYQRLRSGIFDEQSNLRDIEAYLKEILGTGWDSNYEVWQMGMERLAMCDMELARWHDELRQVMKAITDEQAELEKVTAALDSEKNKPLKERSEYTIQTLTAQQEAIQGRLQDLQARADELLNKIKERCRYYNVQMKDMWGFGQVIEAEQQGWRDFLNLSDQAFSQLDDYAARPRTVQPQGQLVSPEGEITPPTFR